MIEGLSTLIMQSSLNAWLQDGDPLEQFARSAFSLSISHIYICYWYARVK